MEENIERTKEEYNNEPVRYCKYCLSLKIISFDEETDYCDSCGRMEIGESSIEDWEEMYERKYNKKYIN